MKRVLYVPFRRARGTGLASRNPLSRLFQAVRDAAATLFAAAAISCALHVPAQALQFSQEGFLPEEIATGLLLPTSIAFHPDGRIFIAQKNGVVRVLENGRLLDTPFVSLTDVNNHRDRGLIGIAVDPDFDNNPFIYLAYTFENDPANIEGPKTARVVRYTADGNVAIEASRRVLIGTVGGSPSEPACADFRNDADCIASDSITHSIGGMRFGPDGKLYIATGDGADFRGIDINAFRAQDLNNLSGKILRIERDGRGVFDNYYHTGNSDDVRSKIWAYGFRNPYRFNFHPTDGRLFVGDVGWSLKEEINLAEPGQNYGWPCREGKSPAGGGYPTLQECQQGDIFTDPIHDYPHINEQGAVTGGAFAISANYPSWLRGAYVFGDFALGELRYLILDSQGQVTSASGLATDVSGPVEIVTGPEGLLYYLSISDGTLNRLNYTGDVSSTPPTALARFETNAATPLTVSFDATESRASTPSPLDYRWDFGDGNSSQNVAPVHTYAQRGVYQVTLTVTAQGNLSDSITFDVDVDDSPASDSQPFIASLTNSDSTTYIGALVTFTAEVGNSLEGEPFSVLFDIVRNDDRIVKSVRFDAVQLAADTTTVLNFDWLPDSTGNYHVNASFYRNSSNTLIQPPTERIIGLQVVARARSIVTVGLGATDLYSVFVGGLIVLTAMRRRKSPPAAKQPKPICSGD